MGHQKEIQIRTPSPSKKEREPDLRTESEGKGGANCKDITKITQWDIVPSVFLHFNSCLFL